MTQVRQLNRFMLLATAPFLGMLIWLFVLHTHVTLPSLPSVPAADLSFRDETAVMSWQLTAAAADSATIKTTLQKFYDLYTKSASEMGAILKQAAIQVSRPAAVFDNRIAGVLGPPIRQASASNADLKLYNFSDKNYKAFALKANLKSDKAMKLVLGQDKIGGSETTLSAAGRNGAIAAVNAGGFADGSRGRFPTGTTMYNGKYVYGFFPSENNLSFVGINTDRKLVGGRFYKQAELDAKKPLFGASFVPILLQNGVKTNIPDPWATSPYRAARTVIGSFKNDQMIIVVADGADESGRSGAALFELQERLLALGVRDAYNLDGGGSSALVFDGQVMNRPSDGKLRPLPTHFLFFK